MVTLLNVILSEYQLLEIATSPVLSVLKVCLYDGTPEQGAWWMLYCHRQTT